MQIVSSGDNLHEMSKPTFCANKENMNRSSAEFAHSMESVQTGILRYLHKYIDTYFLTYNAYRVKKSQCILVSVKIDPLWCPLGIIVAVYKIAHMQHCYI